MRTCGPTRLLEKREERKEGGREGRKEDSEPGFPIHPLLHVFCIEYWGVSLVPTPATPSPESSPFHRRALIHSQFLRISTSWSGPSSSPGEVSVPSVPAIQHCILQTETPGDSVLTPSRRRPPQPCQALKS